ncbi:MAG: asparagine synthase (glutamine-hydrolyzing) [Rubrivivax sp.]|jgi:asparagine synthase (glutamine-hydrolysing)|nr:asparagine synthase (glutamine-hydrolyzing) [Rubrivivax sp.]
MCGIVGSMGRSWLDRLETMVAALAHRGPDDRGLYVDRDHLIALGQARLSIIDLSPAGHQPMTDGSGRYTVVYNGEIYNYRELRAELQAEGAVFRGHSDTEVLLELYVRQGAAMLPRLNGIFALAIWDRQSQELLLARDALGVKPLYFTVDRDGLAFASELKALVPVLKTRTLDPVALHRYLSFLWCPGEGTPIAEVRQLGPGEAMLVRQGRVERRWTWYELPARRGVAATLAESDAPQAVHDALRTAVHRQLVADVPVGAFLSGGLDSSAVVAFAREQARDIRCFTIDLTGGNDAGFTNDLPYARRVAEHLGVHLDVVTVDAGRMAADLVRMVEMLDEPLADPAPLNVLYISRLARENGIKVLLSGAGGDDLFTGYRRHLALRYERIWSWLPASARAGLQRASSRLDASRPVGRRLQRLFANAGATGDERIAAYFAWTPEDHLKSLLGPAMTQAIGATRADQPLLDFLAGMPASTSPMDRMLALEQRFFLADHNLAYTDRMSMAAGVEARVPFLDLDLVELAARVPDRLKQRGTMGKWVLKKAMEPHLPRDVIYRPKTGFGAPLRLWMQRDLRELMDDLLGAPALRARGLFDPTAVQALRTADAAGRVDAAYTLLSMASIEIWCRRFVDQGCA